MTQTTPFRRAFCGVLAGTFLFAPVHASAAALNLSQTPMFLQSPQKPNLIVTLDDSGSMTWAYVPDSFGSDMKTDTGPGTYSPKRIFSSDYNAMYYNPATTYAPPLKADNSEYSTSFTAAWKNGFDTSQGAINLKSAYRPTKDFNPNGSSQSYANHPNDLAAIGATSRQSNAKAYYYTLDTTNASCVSPYTADACYDLHLVENDSADLQQNFANWYSFYRIRNLAVVSAATRAFSKVDPEMRIAWQSLNSCNSFNDSCKGWSGIAYRNKIRRFESNKTDFYSWLSRLPAANSTPLRSAMQRAGKYVMNSGLGIGDVYAYDPNVAGKEFPKYTCRASYAILMTDGMWNSDTPSACSGLSGCSSDNIDGTSYSLPDGVVYTPVAPYIDGTATPNTLADLTFGYWSRDLRPDLGNNVPKRHSDPAKVAPDTTWSATDYWDAQKDPANWQHLTTYAIGLGLAKGLPLATPSLTWDSRVGTFGGSYPAIKSGATKWPVVTATTDNEAKIADLWHAAINGRGRFYAAESPADVINAFTDIFNDISTGIAAAGAAASSSQSYSAGSATYISVYHPASSPKASDASLRPWVATLATGDAQKWWGDLEKFPFEMATSDSLVSIGARPVWSAAAQFAHDASVVASPAKYVDARTILSYNPSNAIGARAVSFRWGNLSASQQSLITGAASVRTGQDRLNWLRGDATHEGAYDPVTTKGGLRARPVTKLGDIVYSSPVYVGAPSDNIGEASYAAFRSAQYSRAKMIYVGGNDGMLHGFRDEDGVETLAYVPSAVYENLRMLTENSAPHHAFVDGHLKVGDAEFSDGWHSVLIGGLRAGGKGYFALDVTNPSFSEGAPRSTVLWEFTAADDAGNNLGYSYGRPVIAKLQNGKWAAIFGNGYNSTSGKAGLYIAYIEEGKAGWSSGSNFKFVDTGAPVGASPNGLSTPTVVDLDGDGKVDAAYAGDLYGNVWKFDLTSFSMGSSPATKKIFSAVDAGGHAQPITVGPEAMLHPKGGVLVLVGTGKAIEDTDVADLSVQSFYGIWDSASPTPVTRAKMLQHVFEPSVMRSTVNGTTGAVYDYELRTVDTATPSWWDPVTNPTGQLGWYVDLMEAKPPATALTAYGERVIEDPQIDGGRIMFVSATPTNDPCNGGGEGWINVMDAVTGARLVVPPFDLNHDGQFGDPDRIDPGKSPTSKRVSPVGGLPTFLGPPPPCVGPACAASTQRCALEIKRSDGTVEMVPTSCSASTGRLNWRDLSR
ncbi:pilus assembly protein [Niveibacterium sp.]|uniref:pilus assembly protein n=1 Tax=Niveibacterium sp. TaxID=2017444 RepID=UPI0035B420EF